MSYQTRRKLGILAGLLICAFCLLEIVSVPALLWIALNRCDLSAVPSWPIVGAFAGVPCALLGGALDYLIRPRRITHSYETRR